MRNTVDAWWCPYRRIGADDVLRADLSPHARREAAAAAWLDDRERARADRFLYPGPRRRYVLLRAALRALLCERLSCSNGALSFGAGEHGKPFAVVNGESAPIHFNLSDSGKHGLIAIADEGQVGVGVEERSSRRDLQGLGQTVFGPDEQTALAAVSGDDMVACFYRLWTVKEALVKAIGTGLYMDLASFQTPPAFLQGETGALFAFPHAPEVQWWVEDVGNAEFAAAIVHEVTASRMMELRAKGGAPLRSRNEG